MITRISLSPQQPSIPSIRGVTGVAQSWCVVSKPPVDSGVQDEHVFMKSIIQTNQVDYANGTDPDRPVAMPQSLPLAGALFYSFSSFLSLPRYVDVDILQNSLFLRVVWHHKPMLRSKLDF